MSKKRRKRTSPKRRAKKQKRPILPLFIFAMLFIFLAVFVGFKATEDGTFEVIDYTSGKREVLNTYHHFILAKHEMMKSDSELICVSDKDGNIVALNHGIVNLKTKNVSENTTYTIDGSDQQGYTNGNYGADALYLDTSRDGTKIKMLLSGVTAWVNTSDIQLYFCSNNVHTSYYYVKDGTLMHAISTSVVDNHVAKYGIGPAPEGLKENTYYYSYDGHWFYTSLNTYARDIKAGSVTHAANKTAYYNYYQYMPHRSKSNLSTTSYSAYLRNLAQVEDNSSALYNSGNLFIQAQKKYGVNAAMMFSLACNESDYGRSSIALNNNNLFGHAVYDSSPDSANSYSSVKQCINSHAYDFIQKGFANPQDSRYHGSWFGDKASGINVDYASDPYWGEKNAAMYYSLEPEIYKKNNLICFQAKKDIDVYDASGSVLYSYKAGATVSFLKIKNAGNKIEVASETPIQNHTSDVKTSYNNAKAYVKKSDIRE